MSARTPSTAVEGSLLQAADAVLRRDGLGGLTVRAVATEAGVAPMGVYSRFGSKDGLVDAVLIRAITSLRAAVGGRGEPDPLERLRNSATRYRAWALENPRHYEAIFLARHGLGPPEVAEHMLAAFGDLIGMVEYALAAKAIQPGEPLEIAQQLCSIVHGAVSLELRGLVLTDDAGRTFSALLDLGTRGLMRE